MRRRSLALAAVLAALAHPCGCRRVDADRPQRARHHAEGEQCRPGPRVVHGARQALERARLGRRQRDPSALGAKQVDFKLDYSGGWGTYKKDVWKTFANTCSASTGPPLAWRVTSCTARDGSHWGLQAWQRMLPNYGLAPSARQAVWELRLSHWTGDLPALTVNLDWAYRKYDHLFGTFLYDGVPVHGFKSTPSGNPLDSFGRNLYVDTFNSAYGLGWKRENSFLTHKGSGTFCYGFYPHGADRPGTASATGRRSSGPA